MSDDEFGPLIIHDGKTIPPTGVILKVFFAGPLKEPIKGAVAQGENWVVARVTSTMSDAGSWVWRKGFLKIVSYRIKKSDGFKLLEKLVSDPPDMLIEDKQLETV